MTRHLPLTAELALVGVLAVLVFPASGSAFRGVGVVLSASGPSPAVLTIVSGLYPTWSNQDRVMHTVVFADGLCTFQIAPGEEAGCSNGWADWRPGSRPDRYHPFRRLGTVVTRGHGAQLQWQLHLRPRAKTIYIAEVDSQPGDGEYWAPARSKPFRVAPRR